MSVDLNTVLAIFAMAVATLATRFGGLVLVRHVQMTERARRVLNAVPPAVLMAVVTPTALASGLAETVACIAAALATTHFSLLPAATIGIVTVAALRGIGF